MIRNALLAAVAATTLAATVQSAGAFPAAASLASAMQPAAEKVSFWGRPFPYQYSWSLVRACTRYQTVDTPRGPVTQKVWVCDVAGREVVVSYRN